MTKTHKIWLSVIILAVIGIFLIVNFILGRSTTLTLPSSYVPEGNVKIHAVLPENVAEEIYQTGAEVKISGDQTEIIWQIPTSEVARASFVELVSDSGKYSCVYEIPAHSRGLLAQLAGWNRLGQPQLVACADKNGADNESALSKVAATQPVGLMVNGGAGVLVKNGDEITAQDIKKVIEELDVIGKTEVIYMPGVPQAGTTGKTGAQGPKGDAGADGKNGANGATGARGAKGATGATGAQGLKGDTGATGAQGATGPAGATGAQGPAGTQGPAGSQGIQGPQGPAGQDSVSGLNYKGVFDSGDTYDKNDTVLATAAGGDTHTYVCIDPSGCLAGGDPTTDTVSWAIIAFQGPTGATGAQGPTGAQGIQGDPGVMGVSGGGLSLVDSTLSLTVCDNGEVLKVSGGVWVCSVDSGGADNQNLTLNGNILSIDRGNYVNLSKYVYTAGNGLTLLAGEFSINAATCGTGQFTIFDGSAFDCDNLPSDVVGLMSVAGGTGIDTITIGDAVTVNLTDTGVAAGAYGSSTQVPQITVDAQGRITDITMTSIAFPAEVDGIIGNEVVGITGANSGLTRSGSGTSLDPYTLAVNVGDGLSLSGGKVVLGISSICSGTDKLTWNGAALSCSPDVDTNTDQQTLYLDSNTKNSSGYEVKIGITNGNVIAFEDHDTVYAAGNGISINGSTISANILPVGSCPVYNFGEPEYPYAVDQGPYQSYWVFDSSLNDWACHTIADYTIINSDNQELSLSGTTLTLQNGGGIDSNNIQQDANIDLSSILPTFSWNATTRILNFGAGYGSTTIADSDHTYLAGAGLTLDSDGQTFKVNAAACGTDQYISYDGNDFSCVSLPEIPPSGTQTVAGVDGIDATDDGDGNVVVGLTSTGVSAGTYGTNSSVPQFSVDAQGRITSVANVPINFPSEVDGVIGNEVLTATTGGGLKRSGGGTASDPYTLGLITTCENNQLLKWSTGSGTWDCAIDNNTDNQDLAYDPATRQLTISDGTSITFPTASADTAGLAVCDGVLGNVFCKNGNSFGAAVALGTNDSYALSFETNGLTRATIDSAGNFLVKNNANSTTAFSVQNSGSTPLFTVDTANSLVKIGDSSASVLVGLVLDGASSDPATATNGEMYYNTSLNVFRCYQNNAWVNCTGGPAKTNVADARSMGTGSTITQTMNGWTFTLTKLSSNNYFGARMTNNNATSHTFELFEIQTTPSDSHYDDRKTITLAAGATSAELETAGITGDIGYNQGLNRVVFEIFDITDGTHWIWTIFYANSASNGRLISEIERY